MAGTIKRWLVWVAAGMLSVSLVVGVAFAGTNGSSGGGADNGNKTGQDKGNKPIKGCGNGWSTDSNTATDWYDVYDLNQNNVVCYQTLDSGWTDYKDDSSNS